ncbi:matrixin family metalloprotease [Horticoccus sp. 23ND18S-11]|uniref:matrixin family metalloprotease n=1 Tax=Horticoccus sp. 23ND18S-11 TaxID=3391832 RepID=UPI0039C9DCDB
MLRRFARCVAGWALAGAVLVGGPLRAFDLIGSSWADGNIVMHLQLGETATPLLDGSPDWASVAESALAEWNQYLTRSTFTVVRNSTATISRSNRINNVIFRADIFGQAFDSRTLAVTLSSTNPVTGRSIEKDVIFNSNRTWSSYRGALRSGISEFRRVALHEFGHVLGLDHPDQATPAQFVQAVMNSTISNIETARTDDIAGARALYDLNGAGSTPTVAAHPQSRTVQVGDSYTFSVTINGAGPFTYAWTFRPAGSAGAESFRLAAGASYTIGSVQPTDAGTYTVAISGPGGTISSNAATLNVLPVSTAADTTLANISTRGLVGTGNNVLIAGLVIGGTTPKNILVRAVGPGLSGFGVSGTLDDPKLTLVDRNAQVVAENDNWESDGHRQAIIAASTRLGAFQFNAGSRDSALLASLPPGNYTAIVSGVGTSTGVALVEAYDADPDAVTARSRRLVNIATRGRVGSADDVLIAGLVVTGPGPRTYLIRGVGPTLANAPFSIAGALSDPFLQVFQGETLLRENDDWDASLSAQPSLRDAAAKVGAFPLQVRRDAAMIITLLPGSYTAKVSGFQGTTGIGLVEIYELP